MKKRDIDYAQRRMQNAAHGVLSGLWDDRVVDDCAKSYETALLRAEAEELQEVLRQMPEA